MPYLKTETIYLGKTPFVLSEYTAYDRILDMEYALKRGDAPKIDPDAPHEERVHNAVELESYYVDLMAHSLAISLLHCKENDFPSRNLEAIQSDIRQNWPNNAINLAFQVLRELNKPMTIDALKTPPNEPEESLTLEKS
ncbi:phage minor tail protein domain-containing protein [Vibrio cholerae]